MSEKIIGYILLALGIIIIIFSGFSVYSVFTKRSLPIQLFNFQSVSIDTGNLVQQTGIDFEKLPEEVQQMLPEEAISSPESSETEIMPAEIINTTSNTFAHLLLMGFIASIGFKLASLGVMLVRPIVVKLKAKENESNKS